MGEGTSYSSESKGGGRGSPDYQLPRQCKWGIGGNLNKIKMNLKSRMKRNREERLDGGVTWM